MKRINNIILSGLFVFLVSCGNKENDVVQKAIEAEVPAYIEVKKVEVKLTEKDENKEVDLYKLVLTFSSKEDLYQSEVTPKHIESKLVESGFFKKYGATYSALSQYKFVSKVLNKNEEKTVYGDVLIETEADNTQKAHLLGIDGFKGKVMSEFTGKKIVVIGSDEESKIVEEIIKTQKAEVEAKKAAEQAQKQAKKNKEKAEKELIAKELAKQKSKLQNVFKKGAKYEGLFVNNTSVKVSYEVVEFEEKFEQGVLLISSKENKEVWAKLKFNFMFNENYKRVGRWEIKTIMLDSVDKKTAKNYKKSSSFAERLSFSYNFQARSWKSSKEKLTIDLGSSGELVILK